jgi:hypothetical protein
MYKGSAGSTHGSRTAHARFLEKPPITFGAILRKLFFGLLLSALDSLEKFYDAVHHYPFTISG